MYRFKQGKENRARHKIREAKTKRATVTPTHRRLLLLLPPSTLAAVFSMCDQVPGEARADIPSSSPSATMGTESTGSRLDLDPVATSKWTTAAVLGASQACSHQRRASENPGGVCFRSPKERQRERRCGGKSSGDVQARAGGGEGDRLKLQAV
ncbi:hypothetical protein HPB47_008290 [Ixodes persulcatus]|uniref:Uncharacterized protein n=1 Tax=Ixodes persulcatus TaxID=34615 RepID=A0AC60P580_IXOPE|nr:hypothetical protein HPB47_008290 [Ixodes persulcatus]